MSRVFFLFSCLLSAFLLQTGLNAGQCPCKNGGKKIPKSSAMMQELSNSDFYAGCGCGGGGGGKSDEIPPDEGK